MARPSQRAVKKNCNIFLMNNSCLQYTHSFVRTQANMSSMWTDNKPKYPGSGGTGDGPGDDDRDIYVNEPRRVPRAIKRGKPRHAWDDEEKIKEEEISSRGDNHHRSRLNSERPLQRRRTSKGENPWPVEVVEVSHRVGMFKLTTRIDYLEKNEKE